MWWLTKIIICTSHKQCFQLTAYTMFVLTSPIFFQTKNHNEKSSVSTILQVVFAILPNRRELAVSNVCLPLAQLEFTSYSLSYSRDYERWKGQEIFWDYDGFDLVNLSRPYRIQDFLVNLETITAWYSRPRDSFEKVNRCLALPVLVFVYAY